MSACFPTRPSADENPVDFGEFVRSRGGRGSIVAQPRMGFSDPNRMREGLIATKKADAHTVGTLTLDSYTRVGDHEAADTALREGLALNGYPIVNHPVETTQWVLDGIRDDEFPVQVRHGSATPLNIFASMVALNLNATEGGPVSYCLPYGRVPLQDSVRNWSQCCEMFTQLQSRGIEPHLETFGGCMMGQLCPPSMLVAISVLEALFFANHGLRSVSVSYAQQTNLDQDIEAVQALRALCAELLPTDNWHVVIYTYMGMYPTTDHGCENLLGSAAQLAVATGAERVIVKTVAESRRIPTIAENVQALEHAHNSTRVVRPEIGRSRELADSQTYQEARALVMAVLNLHSDLGQALLLAFKQGYLDVPYCLHPDNAGRSRSYIDADGWLRWGEVGSLPLGHLVPRTRSRRITSSGLLDDLSYVRRKYDEEPSTRVEVGV
ncbi:methylaspartate mutase [Kutzneria sp. 744]|uniref:methylaspartate mutase n=1 Tax=Kutzneria sp. (strain 744) TaxID=345341 RepID=UPI0003EEB0C2|nr:methylaspartate mutase [Kutzneria sp. 744]EWM17464.1 methylaspartate mutase subunit E MutE [Kutzneria sp. 744]